MSTEPMFTATLYGSAELAQQAHIAWLRQRVAELLEKAENLEEAARCVQDGEWHKDSLQIERMEMQKAIAKVRGTNTDKARDLSSAGKATAEQVYGSAPE